jgi:hypothetical protein
MSLGDKKSFSCWQVQQFLREQQWRPNCIDEHVLGVFVEPHVSMQSSIEQML